MSESSPIRILSFAVTSALLAGGAGCTDDKTIYSNPGPVPQPTASPTPGASLTPSVAPDDTKGEPGDTKSEAPEGAKSSGGAGGAGPRAQKRPQPKREPLEGEDIIVNPGPNRDPQAPAKPAPR